MNSKRGFTLIELMIVVVIIGILAALAIPKFGEVSKRSKEAEATPILKQLYTLQERHLHQHGIYATTITELEGGGGNFSDGKYYGFRLGTGTASTYVACATPLDAALNLQPFRINEDGNVSVGTC